MADVLSRMRSLVESGAPSFLSKVSDLNDRLGGIAEKLNKEPRSKGKEMVSGLILLQAKGVAEKLEKAGFKETASSSDKSRSFTKDGITVAFGGNMGRIIVFKRDAPTAVES